MTVVRVEIDPFTTVIPAKAGIQTELASPCLHADPTRLDLDNNIYVLLKRFAATAQGWKLAKMWG